jgi:hypothetical protein
MVTYLSPGAGGSGARCAIECDPDPPSPPRVRMAKGAPVGGLVVVATAIPALVSTSRDATLDAFTSCFRGTLALNDCGQESLVPSAAANKAESMSVQYK